MNDISGNGKFLENILSILQAMGSISTKKCYNAIGLYKDNVLFGLVDNNNIFLKSNNSAAGGNHYVYNGNILPYKQIANINKILAGPATNDADNFLRLATESYWYATKDKD